MSTRPLVSTSTLTVATATVSVYRAMFTLSVDNVHYQPLLSTFNEKTKIKKYDHNTFSDMTISPTLGLEDLLLSTGVRPFVCLSVCVLKK